MLGYYSLCCVSVTCVNSSESLLIQLCCDSATHEAGGVVVTGGLRITEGLQNRVCLDDLVLQVTLRQQHKGDVVRTSHRCKVNQHFVWGSGLVWILYPLAYHEAAIRR